MMASSPSYIEFGKAAGKGPYKYRLQLTHRAAAERYTLEMVCSGLQTQLMEQQRLKRLQRQPDISVQEQQRLLTLKKEVNIQAEHLFSLLEVTVQTPQAAGPPAAKRAKTTTTTITDTVLTFEKFDPERQGGQSLTAKYHAPTGVSVIVKVPVAPNSRLAKPVAPKDASHCPIINTSIYVQEEEEEEAEANFQSGIQIMEAGITDLWEVVFAREDLTEATLDQVIKWIYGAAACLLEKNLVVPDWKLENIAVMQLPKAEAGKKFVGRVIDIETIHTLGPKLQTGSYTLTYDITPIFPLQILEEELHSVAARAHRKAQLVLIMVWAVQVSVEDAKRRTINQPPWKPATWNEYAYFKDFFKWNHEDTFTDFATICKMYPTEKEWEEKNEEKIQDRFYKWLDDAKKFLIKYANAGEEEGANAHRKIAIAFADLCAI